MRAKSFITFFIFLFPLLISGQTYYEMIKINSDSLQQILPKLEGKEKIIALNKIAFSCSRDHPDSSILISNKTKLLSEGQDYQEGIAHAHFNLGLTYFFLDSLRLSVFHLFTSLRIYETTEPSIEMGCVLEQIQAINFMTHRYKKSKMYGRRAIKTFNVLGDTLYMSRLIYCQALTCTENHEWDSATFYNMYAARYESWF